MCGDTVILYAVHATCGMQRLRILEWVRNVGYSMHCVLTSYFQKMLCFALIFNRKSNPVCKFALFTYIRGDEVLGTL